MPPHLSNRVAFSRLVWLSYMSALVLNLLRGLNRRELEALLV